MSKPALLVVNKMDLPDAEDKLAELKEQLQNPEGDFVMILLIQLPNYKCSSNIAHCQKCLFKENPFQLF